MDCIQKLHAAEQASAADKIFWSSFFVSELCRLDRAWNHNSSTPKTQASHDPFFARLFWVTATVKACVTGVSLVTCAHCRRRLSAGKIDVELQARDVFSEPAQPTSTTKVMIGPVPSKAVTVIAVVMTSPSTDMMKAVSDVLLPC